MSRRTSATRKSAARRKRPGTVWRLLAGASRLVPWWAKLAAVLMAPLLALNLSVAFFGESYVFPLSPYFLREKLHALKIYARHRPGCLLSGHGPLDADIVQAEARHRIPRGLLQALIEVESGRRPHRISAAGAMGPGQLMPGTAADLRVADPFEPMAGIDGSARYLARQLARFGQLDLALAAYNAGPGSIRNRRVPQNGETEHYVVKVMRAYRLLEPGPAADPPAIRR